MCRDAIIRLSVNQAPPSLLFSICLESHTIERKPGCRKERIKVRLPRREGIGNNVFRKDSFWL